MKRIYLHLFICLLITVSCNNKTTTSKSEVTLRQEWLPNSNYCGATFAKEKFGDKNNISIKIVPGDYSSPDPIKMVMAGKYDIGDAGADRVLEAISKGVDLIVIGVVNISSPTCFIAKKNKNIKRPKDFEGKRVGVLVGTNTEYVYKTLIQSQKLDKTSIKEIEGIPFDLQTFILDEYDVRPAFIYDEPVTLDMRIESAKNVKEKDNLRYDIIEPRDYGINYIGTVYFTTRKFVEEHPDRVQAFINSVADGWKATLKYPDAAIEHLKKNFPEIDFDREKRALKKGENYFEGKNGKILWADMEDWDETISYLQDLNVIESIKISNHIDNTFLVKYYENSNNK